jgi:hypothetical protein
MQDDTFTRGIGRMIATLRPPDKAGVSAPLVATFRERFAGLDEATFAAACEYAIDNDDFFPTIRRFREIVATIDVAGGARLDGPKAWEAFMRRVVRSYSPGITKVFDWPDERTRQIVREELGGVHFIAHVESDYQLDKLRERFVKAYDQGANVADAQERARVAAPAPLRQIGGNQ